MLTRWVGPAVTKAQPTRLASGAIVGNRYRVDGVVGKGGFGAVYRATQLDTRRAVALKVLLKNFSTAATDYRRFQREAALLLKLHHPHVVELLDYGQTERGQPYIAFELLHGRALSQVLKESGRLSLWRAGRIAREILWALEAAHAIGVIHRDIKPQNVFLCDGSGAAKVLDFGIAKAVSGDEAGSTQLTEAGAMLGTPHYMAPEQVRGAEIVPATDLYALGLLIGEMLFGRRLVKASSLIDVYMQHIKEEPIVLPDEVRGSPLASIVARATEKDLARRYASAAQMRADLDAVLPAAATSEGRQEDRLDATTSLLEATLSDLDATAERPRREKIDLAAGTVIMATPEMEQQAKELAAVLDAPSQPNLGATMHMLPALDDRPSWIGPGSGPSLEAPPSFSPVSQPGQHEPPVPPTVRSGPHPALIALLVGLGLAAIALAIWWVLGLA